MSNRTKNLIYSALLITSVFAVWMYRQNQNEPMRIEGQTMGTTYHITYFDDQKRNFKKPVDSLLEVINQSLNTYLPNSEVSIFNNGPSAISFSLPYLRPVLEKSQEVYTASSGAFDPTVFPLVNAWGFGPGEPLNPGNLLVDSIRDFVGFEKIKFNTDSLWKLDPRTELDFGGIGQGYGADVITEFLRAKGVTNMLVELGGEGMAIGKNLKTNKPWEIGILDPASTRDHLFFKAYVSLENKSFTTSGNYFNYRVIDGRKYSHSIDPETGYPARKAILSASVFAEDAATADAWATAFMVMGHEKAIERLTQRADLDGLIMYSDKEGKIKLFISKGIEPFVTIKE